MSQFIRKAQPDCLRYFLQILCCPNSSSHEESNNSGREVSCTVDDLVEVLIKQGNFSITVAKECVANALRDGILMPVSASVSTNRTAKSVVPELKLLRLPKQEEIKKNSSNDFYCYECHLPGKLDECRQCWRSFHRSCYRKNPERPNYIVPSTKIQKNRLPAFSSDTDSEADDATIRCFTTLGNESDTVANSIQTEQNKNATNNESLASPQTEGKPTLEDLESKTKVDVVCMGEIRPPNRKRPNTTASNVSYKNEVTPSDEDEQDLELCTSCRLLKRADLRNPANLKPDELCHLVKFTFDYNREWLTNDVRTYLEAERANENEIKLVSDLLLHSKLRGLSEVGNKIENKKYAFLMEFLVDMLDIQHCIGVFFGTLSTEIESTKWMLRDVTHDLSEIRRCPDCFRYSHEKQSTIWFAKPCVQRHELVYAKHSGFPYWPAKVIRVLPSNKFDVRFFGGNHSRALIDVRFIKPIDADTKSLKLGNSPAIKKAMEELRYHQMLSSYTPSAFSFHADPKQTEEILRTVLGTSVMNNDVKEKLGKRNRKNSLINFSTENFHNSRQLTGLNLSQSSNNEDVLSSSQTTMCTEVSVSVKRLKLNNINKVSGEENNVMGKKATRKIINTFDADERIKMINELENAQKLLKDLKQKNAKFEAQKIKLKEKLKKQELESKVIKRKQWCYWCLEEAIYLCCFRAAYCSEMCQARHWKDGHKDVCKNQSANINP